MKEQKKEPALEKLNIRLTPQQMDDLKFISKSVGMAAATFARVATLKELNSIRGVPRLSA